MSLVAVTTVTTVGTAGSRLNDDVKESIVSGSVDSKNNSDDNVKVTNAMTGSLGESGPCTINNQQSNNIENEQNERDTMILAAGTSIAAGASVTAQVVGAAVTVKDKDTKAPNKSELAVAVNNSHENNKHVSSEIPKKEESDEISKPMEQQNDDVSLVAVATVTTVGSMLNDDVKESKTSGSEDSKNDSQDNVNVTNARTGSSGESTSCTVDNQQSNNIENEQNERDTMILAAGTSIAAVTTVENENDDKANKSELVVAVNNSHENNKHVNSENAETNESDEIAKSMKQQNDDVSLVAVTTVGVAEIVANSDVKEFQTSGISHDSVKVTNDRTMSSGESNSCTGVDQQSNSVENEIVGNTEQNKSDTIMLTAGASVAVGASLKNESTDASKNSELGKHENYPYENNKNISSEISETDEINAVPTTVPSNNGLRTSQDFHYNNHPHLSSDIRSNELSIQTEPSMLVEERNDRSPKSTGNIYRSGWNHCLNEKVKNEPHHFSTTNCDPELAETMFRRKRLSNEKEDKTVKNIEKSTKIKAEADTIYRSGWTRPLKNSTSPTSFMPM